MAIGSFSLFTAQGRPTYALPGSWRYLYAPTGQGEAYASPDLEDAHWPLTSVPEQHAATRDRGAIWYRVRFARPVGGPGRWLLRFGGAFQATTVWLNGAHLGQHYGYFSPFAFDITDDLADENLLVVCCESRVEWDLPAKKSPMGVLNDWDCKPYPNSARGALPDEYPWTQPLGLWAPVTLEAAGDALIEHVSYSSTLYDDRSAVVRVVARVTSLVDRPLTGELTVSLNEPAIAPASPAGTPTGATSLGVSAAVGAVPVTLRPHATTTVTLDLPVARPRLWWPWTHGEPFRYTAGATLSGPDGHIVTSWSQFGIRSVEYREDRLDGPGWLINGRPIFPMGSNYICDFRLDSATDDRHRADLQLMKEANMNFVRVHAHVEPDSFYTAADELGMLVLCDGVLNGCYVFGAPPEDRVFFAWAARDQVEKLVRYHQNHPAIIGWMMHNEPPWPTHCWWFGEPHRSRVCRDVDQQVGQLARDLDPTRPVLVASGDKDEHTYGGWYNDTWLHYLKITPRFCTEYGAQALPSLHSPVWSELNSAWPVAPTDPTWIYRNYQAYQWATFGVGAPDQFATLAEYIDASQHYQAWISRLGAERFRRLKFQPSAGIAHFMFVDGHPGITWSVVDYHRLPKQGYHALRDAFRPTHVIIEPAGTFTTDRLGSLIYRPGESVTLDLWLVNDNPGATGPITVEWVVEGEAGVIGRGTTHGWIPADTEPALPLTTISWTAPDGATDLVVRTLLHQDGRLLEEHSLALVIRPQPADADPARPAAPPLRVTGATRTTEGLHFTLQNPYHPVAWKELLAVSLDGVDLPQAALLAERMGVLQPLQDLADRPLTFLTGVDLPFLLGTDAPVDPGEHLLTLRVRIAGYGPVTLQFVLTAV